MICECIVNLHSGLRVLTQPQLDEVGVDFFFACHKKEEGGKKDEEPTPGVNQKECPYIFGGCLVGVMRVSGGCLEGVWIVSGGCLDGVWRVSSIANFCSLPLFSFRDREALWNRMVSRGCMEGVWRVSGWYLEAV